MHSHLVRLLAGATFVLVSASVRAQVVRALGAAQGEDPPGEINVNDPAYGGLEGALASPGTANKTLLIPTEQPVSRSLLVPADRTLRFTGSGRITIPQGATLTVNARILAPFRQIFGGAGRVAFGPGTVESVYPQWWGAVGDGVAPDDDPLRAAIEAAPRGGTVALPVGVYLVTRTLMIDKPLTLRGFGVHVFNGSLMYFGDAGWTVPGHLAGSIIKSTVSSGDAIFVGERGTTEETAGAFHFYDLAVVGSATSRLEHTEVGVRFGSVSPLIASIRSHWQNVLIGNFATGLVLTGMEQCTFVSLRITGTITGLISSSDMTNGNTFIGIEVNNFLTAAIDLQGDSNAFYGGIIQAAHPGAQDVVTIRGPANKLIGLRFENDFADGDDIVVNNAGANVVVGNTDLKKGIRVTGSISRGNQIFANTAAASGPTITIDAMTQGTIVRENAGFTLVDPGDVAIGLATEAKVGIGTRSPANKLDIIGNDQRMRIGDGTHDLVFGQWDPASNRIESVGRPLVITTYTGNVTLGFSGHADMSVTPSGDVGIGTTNPRSKLDVTGSVHALEYLTDSDLELKEDVVPLTETLDKLDQIQAVSFRWNKRAQALGHFGGRRALGVIAQEVATVFPELVSTSGREEYQSVDYGKLTTVLLAAVKELQAENKRLGQRLDVLEAK